MHDVYVMDEAGGRLAARRLPEGLAGIRQLHELIAEHADEPDQVLVGTETDRGLWVVLARAHQSLIWSRTRHANALRSA